MLITLRAVIVEFAAPTMSALPDPVLPAIVSPAPPQMVVAPLPPAILSAPALTMNCLQLRGGLRRVACADEGCLNFA